MSKEEIDRECNASFKVKLATRLEDPRDAALIRTVSDNFCKIQVHSDNIYFNDFVLPTMLLCHR